MVKRAGTSSIRDQPGGCSSDTMQQFQVVIRKSDDDHFIEEKGVKKTGGAAETQ